MNRFSSLTRKTPLRRKTRLRSYSKTKKYARRERDRDYMNFIRWCDCILKDVKDASSCHRKMEADHAGERGGGINATAGKGEKAPDRTCIPMCKTHHGERTDYHGYFKGWDGDRMRAWCDEKIHFYQTLYKNLLGLKQTPWRAA